jgi:HK97 family phage portal protein
MANILTSMLGWFGLGENALSERVGEQHNKPGSVLISDINNVKTDGALQLSAVWSCVDRRANIVASLPLFAYQRDASGQKTLDRTSGLYQLLHDSPNSRMTPLDFWRVMMLNHDLRGNAYARIDRNAKGEAISLWPMPADQVEVNVLLDGTVVYLYRLADSMAVLAEENVLHLKNLGNGTVGFAKLDFMRVTTDEMYKAQESASKLFGAGGKPTGVLMYDGVLKPEQRAAIRTSFSEMSTTASTGRLFVLEASMKYQQLGISPEDQQLLESRKFGVEEICRWFDVPPVLAHHSNVTTWGTGVEAIIDGWYKLSIRPLLVGIEQAITKRVLTSQQRARMSVEFSFDALLRGNIKDRFEVYAKGVQNGITTRNEARQLENLPPVTGGDELTAQVNLAPLAMLGQTGNGASNAANTQNDQAQ